MNERQRNVIDRASNILKGMARSTNDKARLVEINDIANCVKNCEGQQDEVELHAFILYLRQRLIALQLNPGATSAGQQIDA